MDIFPRRLSRQWLCFAVLFLVVAGCGPTTPEAIFQQGKARYEQSDWEGAADSFTRCLGNSYKPNESYRYRAYARAQKGDATGAQADCQQIKALEPHAANAYYWCARVENVLSDTDAALTDFEMGQVIDPQNRPADLAEKLAAQCMGRAYLRYAHGNLNEAVVDLDEAINIGSTNTSIYFLRGWMRFLQQDLPGALKDDNTAIQQHCDSPEVYELRAWICLAMNDVTAAKENARQAVKLWQSYHEPLSDQNPQLVSAGLLAYLNGDFAGAVKQWTQMLKTNEDLPTPYRAFLQAWVDKTKAKSAGPQR